MALKLYDLAVKVGEYTDSSGKSKGRWVNVGAVMENQDGGRFIMLDRTFNPAGVPNPDNRPTILLSMFEPRAADAQQLSTRHASRTEAHASRRAPRAPADAGDDDIPF